MFPDLKKRIKKIGQPPGTPMYTGNKKQTVSSMQIIHYNEHDFREVVSSKFDASLLTSTSSEVTWINVEGLSDIALIEQLAKHYHIHPLTIEDILNVEQRSKIEEFEGYLFITIKVLSSHPQSKIISIEELSIVLGNNVVLTFQEQKTAIFDLLIDRLRSSSTQRLRQQKGDYLVYRLIDTVIDQYFLVLEELGDKVGIIEENIIETSTPHVSHTLYQLKRQILVLRKAIWPMREVISRLMQSEEKMVSAFTRIYLRDAYDHAVQAIDTVETFRDMISGLLDVYLSILTNRMNEIMKMLTIIATIFIPITFIASVYGMNFEHMPELHWRFGYPLVLFIMSMVVVAMLIYFRKNKWL